MPTGISWPFRIERGEFPATSEDTQQIEDSLRTILSTQKGELIMAPEFGLNSKRYVFENNDIILAEALKYEVATAIAKFEPRVGVRQINITQRDSELTLTIQYFIKATRQDRSLEVNIPRT